MSKKDYKHLSIDDRLTIQAMLHNTKNITEIALRIGVAKSTISRELKRNSYVKLGNKSYFVCRDEKKYPVCNICPKRGLCSLSKHYYNFNDAERMSEERNKNSRMNSTLNKEEIKLIDKVIYDGVKLGQSLHHIYESDEEIKKICSERTIRRLIYRDMLKTKAHELRRYVRYKREYKKEVQPLSIRNIKYLDGRTYSDFKKATSRKDKMWVEFDSVIGKKTDKRSILTIHFPFSNFQFGILIAKGNSVSLNYQLKKLFTKLGIEMTKLIFSICLCDNGSEFSTFYENEKLGNETICHTYFANPYRATDKAYCERNHEFIRYAIPKGITLDNLKQDDVDELFSNINSYVRSSRGDKTPYEIMEKKYGTHFMDLINIHKIPRKKVKLTQIV